MSSYAKGFALVMGATLVWSSGGLIVRAVTADSWTVVFWRSISSAAFLLAFIWLVERQAPWTAIRRAGLPSVLVGIFFAIGSLSFIIALGLTTVANVLMIQSLSPMIAALMARVVLKESIDGRTWAAIFVSFLGIAIMLGRMPSGDDLIGTLCAFANAVAYSAAIVTVRSQRDVPMAAGGWLAAVFGALIALPFAAPLSVPEGELPLLIFFGAGQLGVGMAMFTAGARYIPAAQSSLISLVETALGPLWVWLAFGENPGAWVLIGGSIVVGALVVHTLAARR